MVSPRGSCLCRRTSSRSIFPLSSSAPRSSWSSATTQRWRWKAPGSRKSEWVLFTSGTTGIPKMVAHSLEALTGAIQPGTPDGVVCGTFYDIRRYGGLQILLRALLGQASLILSDAEESAADFLLRLARHGVTHLTGTPSHWRRAVMSRGDDAICPRYIRLSGEIADQA